MPIEELLDLSAHGIVQIDVSPSEIQAYSKLRFPLTDHRDPFDRMIAVQAHERGATLLTANRVFSAYLLPDRIVFV